MASQERLWTEKMPVDPWKKFHRFIDAVGVVRQERHFKLSLETLSRSLGFERYAYLNIRLKSGFALSNYPQEWQDRYFRRSYQGIDPVVEIAKRKRIPFIWSLDDSAFVHQESRAFSSEANAFGIRSGVTIPIPVGFGHISMLTFASVEPATDPAHLGTAPAVAVASLTHAFVTIRRHCPSASSVVTLTPKEAVSLRWAAEGKSMQEIAMLLDIKYTSARSYLDSARKKLGAVTLIQAVASATRLNLI